MSKSGKVWLGGSNLRGQCGVVDYKNVNIPILFSPWKDFKFIDFDLGGLHTLFLTKLGMLYGMGNNKYSQLGVGEEIEKVDRLTRIKLNLKLSYSKLKIKLGKMRTRKKMIDCSIKNLV